MEEEFDSQRSMKRLKAEWNRILRSDKLSEENKKILRDYKDSCLDREFNGCGIERNLWILRKTAEILNKSFRNANEIDLRRTWRELKVKWSSASKRDYLATINVFYRWLFRVEELPEPVAWTKPILRKLKREYKLPEDMLTEEEVLKMVRAEKTTRNKAVIYTLFMSGCRASELLRFRIKDVAFDEKGAVLSVRQTKGYRRIRKVRCIECAPILRSWIHEHSHRKDPNAPLWIDVNGSKDQSEMKRMSYYSLKALVKRSGRKAKIGKRVYCHLFRHSRATDLAKKGFNEVQLREFFGWARESKTPSNYMHLAEKDLDNALLKAAGLPTGEEKFSRNPVRCPRCNEINNPSNDFCIRCGWNLKANIVDLIKEDIEIRISSGDGNNDGSLPLKKECPRCSYKSPVINRFCAECGMPFHIIREEKPVGAIAISQKVG